MKNIMNPRNLGFAVCISLFSLIPNSNAQEQLGFMNHCDFGAPSLSALPTIKKSFKNVFVFQNGVKIQADLSRFTVNWDLEKKKLKKIVLTSNDGRQSIKTIGKLDKELPHLSFEETDNPLLQGNFYPILDGDNLVLVSAQGEITIYLSNDREMPFCRNSKEDLAKL